MFLPEEIELYRDRNWRRDPELRVEDVFTAERFIDEVGFCSALTDSRRPGPSLYIAVCGRRDAHSPRNVQKDPESRLAELGDIVAALEALANAAIFDHPALFSLLTGAGQSGRSIGM
jgi:hypothetical protein